MPLTMISRHTNAAASFREKAKSYEAHALVQAHAAEWLSQWIPTETDGSRCLEFGAGTGLLTRHLMEQFRHLECSDIEPAMVELCREKFPAATHSVRDAWAAHADTAQWNLITASSVLQWAKEPESVMANWRKLLKPDGRIIVGFFIQPSLPEMSAVIGDESPLVWRDAEEWQAVFDASGLEVVRMESDTRRYHYSSALEFWKSLHSTGTTVSRKISPGQLMRFFKDYELRFSDHKGVYATWTFCRVKLKNYL